MALKGAKSEDKDAINAGFDRQIQAADADWQLATEQNNQAQQAAEYDRQLATYRQFVEEYLRIEEEKEQRAQEIRNLAESGEITQEEATQRLDTSENVALAEKTNLQAEMGMTAEEVSSIIGEVVANTVQMSIDQISSQLPAVQAELRALQAAGADPAKIAKTTMQVNRMVSALGKAKKGTTAVQKATNSGAKDSKGDWKIVTQALGTVNDAISEVNNAFGDMFGEAGQIAMDIMQTTLSATIGILNAVTTTSQNSNQSISAAEKASVILAIISAAVQVITAITNAIMQNFSAQAMYKKSMEEYDAKLDEVDVKWEKIKAKNEMKSGSDYWKSLAEGAQEYTEKTTLLNGQLFETQQRLKEINENQGDPDKVSKKEQEVLDTQNQTEQEIINNDKELYELRQQLLEEFATTSLESFAQSMAESMVEGFTEGMNGIDGAWEDTLKNLQKDMLTRQLALKLEDQFKDAFDKLSGYTSDGDLTDSEMQSFYSMMEQSSANAQAIGEQYRKMMAEMGLLDDADIEGESKGFEAMSQDTADELNGRFTALQVTGANIELKLGEQIEIDRQALVLSQSIRDNIDLATQIASDQLQELRTISANTALLEETNARLKQIQDYTSRL